jgi:histone H3/H4
MTTHFTTKDRADLLVSNEAVEFRRQAISAFWDLITAEAGKIAKEHGERTITSEHIKEAARRVSDQFAQFLKQSGSPTT